MNRLEPREPLPFEPHFEQIPDDEDETVQEMVDVMRQIADKTYEDSGLGLRCVHAKAHGLLQGRMTVMPGLPAAYAQGAFALAGEYPLIMRISTNPGDILADSVSTPRGLAIKIVGVDGERLEGSEEHRTQDFVMQNAPAFTAPDAKTFLKTLKLLAKTTDKSEGAKKALSGALRGAERVIEALGGESPTLKSLGGHPETHPLGETFYTMAPFLYGPYFAKLSVVPVSPELTALTDAPLNVNGRPNGLREGVTAFFAEHGGAWEVRVQLGVDMDKTPIEDASVEWPEELAPFVAVARIEVGPQPSWNDVRVQQIDDGMAFSPWNGLQAHRPLGGIMRSRKPAYEMSSQLRSSRSGCPLHEPASGLQLN